MEHLFVPYIRKMMTMEEPHATLFVAPTGVGKALLAMDLLKREYFNHFRFHCNHLHQPATHPDVLPLEVVFD